jgi:hypothetical protein
MHACLADPAAAGHTSTEPSIANLLGDVGPKAHLPWPPTYIPAATPGSQQSVHQLNAQTRKAHPLSQTRFLE